MEKSDRKEILTNLRRNGFKLGLATKAKKFKVDKILKALGLIDFFDSVITGDVTKKYKPNPEIYLNSLKNLGISNSEAIVVEDSPHGIKSAKSAGIKVIAYKTKPFSKEDLKQADFIINNLNEIFDLLKNKVN